MEIERFEGWAVVELMGHRRRAGFVRDVEMFGTRMLRIDVSTTKDIAQDGEKETLTTTEFYGGAALYGMHPCDEATAKRAADQAMYDSPIRPYAETKSIPFRTPLEEAFDFEADSASDEEEH